MLRSNARSPSITSQESYSAVMITDLVADVNINSEIENSTRSTKEETNLAFDGHADEGVKKNSLEDANSPKIIGGGISKGVILNAVQFSPNDSKKTFDEKPMQLSASLAVPTLTQPPPDPKGFKDMTLARKIAFGFSFLPSIFFVLCFAVILPCKVPKPCVDEVWTVTFNNTEPLSRLELTKNLVLTAFKEGGNVLLELEKTRGNFKEIELPFQPAYLKCRKTTLENQTDCIVMDDSRNVYTFSNKTVSKLEDLPHFEIFSDCTDKLENIGFAVSNSSIKILHGGNKVSALTVNDCDSVPMKLASWKIGNSSDILFICDKDGEDRLVKVSSNAWCVPSQKSSEKPLVLKTGSLDSLKEGIFQPLENDGLVLWFGNEVSMIQSNGTLLWNVSNLSHPDENRFILHGNFLGENKHLALISSNLISGLQVTLLNPSDGSNFKKMDFQNTESLEAIHIKGKKRDFVVLLVRKIEAPLDSMTAALTKISDISSTIVSILSNEKLNDGTSKPTVEELAILDMEENLDTVKDIKIVNDSTHKSTMTANTDEHGILSVYLLSQSSDNPQVKNTEVKNINIANWDKSSKYKCLAKK